MQPIGRVARFANQMRACYKFCLSFRKRDWELGDYPISMRTQDTGPAPEGSRFKLPSHVASIVNWSLSGVGETRDEALQNLQKTFADVKLQRKQASLALPRPGTTVPVEFASRKHVSQHPELAEDFIRRILGYEWAWISDESSLWDFSGEETNDSYYAKISEVYGADVSDIQSAKLWEILDRIAAHQRARD
jgi:hypothetical protein